MLPDGQHFQRTGECICRRSPATAGGCGSGAWCASRLPQSEWPGPPRLAAGQSKLQPAKQEHGTLNNSGLICSISFYRFVRKADVSSEALKARTKRGSSPSPLPGSGPGSLITTTPGLRCAAAPCEEPNTCELLHGPRSAFSDKSAAASVGAILAIQPKTLVPYG